MIAPLGFDWTKKSLGWENNTPTYCLICDVKLCIRGWIRWGDHVNCLSCGGTFEIMS